MTKHPDELTAGILASAKYRLLGIPVETVRDLLEGELPLHRSQKEAVKAARQKLHNIVAPYLGDVDFTTASVRLEVAFQSGVRAVQETCREILLQHASTRERMPILEDFYHCIFAQTGTPRVLLDLACGLNPLAFNWMGLPTTVRYHAYDINLPRVKLINHYFTLQGLAPLAECRDVLLDPPTEHADVAFFFKEAHRFEQRRPGCNRDFWQALNVRWLVISLPPSNLTGKRSLVERQRRLVHDTLEGLNWQMRELMFENEMVFCIEKPGMNETEKAGFYPAP